MNTSGCQRVKHPLSQIYFWVPNRVPVRTCFPENGSTTWTGFPRLRRFFCEPLKSFGELRLFGVVYADCKTGESRVNNSTNHPR